MAELWIAHLELSVIGGLGVLLVVAGIAAQALAKKANDSCIARTEGVVVRHRYADKAGCIP